MKWTSYLAVAPTEDRFINKSPASVTQWETGLLTSDEHDTDRKDLLRVGVGGDIPKADAGQTTEGEIERRHILIFDGGAWGRVSGVVFFSCSKKDKTSVLLHSTYLLPQLSESTYWHPEVVQPANLMLQIRLLHVADCIPDAS